MEVMHIDHWIIHVDFMKFMHNEPQIQDSDLSCKNKTNIVVIIDNKLNSD